MYLTAITLIFSLPFILWRFGRVDFFAPLIVIQILTGMIVGSSAFGSQIPELIGDVFNPEVINSLDGIAVWAVMLLVWSSGVELEIKNSTATRNEGAIVPLILLMTPFIFGSLAAMCLSHFSGGKGQDAHEWQFILGIGISCSVTALPILIIFMERLGIFHTLFGQRTLSYSSLDDIAIWVILAAILMDWSTLMTQFLFLSGFIVVSIFVRCIISRTPAEERLYVGLIWLSLSAVTAEWAGLNSMIGAFLAGVILDANWFERKQMRLIREFVLIFLMPIYFFTTGIKSEWDINDTSTLATAFFLLIISVLGKFIGAGVSGWLYGWKKREIFITGSLLQTKALILIIFANTLLEKGIITSNTYTSLLLMAIGSTMLTVPLTTSIIKKWHIS